MKKIWLTVCLVFAMFSLTACASNTEKLAYDETAVTEAAKFVINNLAAIDEESLERMAEMDPESDNAQSLDEELKKFGEEKGFGSALSFEAFQDAIEGYLTSAKDLGHLYDEIEKKSDHKIETTAKEIKVIYDLDFSKHDATFEFIYDKNMKLESTVINVDYSTKEILTKAALNTVLGMGTVFVVLLLIAFIISLFKHIPELLGTGKAEPSLAELQGEINEETDVDISDTSDESDNKELIAVISAAIAASEDAPADGFIVRSIKRRKSNKW